MALKDELQDLGISGRFIASSLQLGVSTVSDILNNKYKGSELTKQKVYDFIQMLKESKEDLNSLIYPHAELVFKALHLAIENRKFNYEEKKKLMEISEPINEYIKANKETDSDRDSN